MLRNKGTTAEAEEEVEWNWSPWKLTVNTKIEKYEGHRYKENNKNKEKYRKKGKSFTF
jgi:hypothetical protein